jgi:CBS domain-containing protein
MRCQEIMKQLVECVSPKDPVRSAAQRMRSGNIGFLPVCSEDRRVLGTLTDRDIALRIVSEGRPATTPVDEIMTREVVACRPEDSVKKAEQLMGHYRKSRILCLDGSGRLAGVLSLSDLAELETGGAARTLREIAQREARVP